MILIIGLGNPGKKYQNTRHNIGFEILDLFSEENGFPEFSLFEQGKSLVSQKDLEGEKIILAKPRTFMNSSGKSAKLLSKFYKPKSLLVIHDDIDLPLGEMKMEKGRGSAGHKGADSVIRELGSKDFWRLRIGICPKTGKPKEVEKFVLGKLAGKDIKEKAAELLKEKIIEKRPG